MNIRTNFRKHIARTIAVGVALATVGVAANVAPAHAAAKCSSTVDCIGAINIAQQLPGDVAIPTFKFNTTVPTKATMTIKLNGAIVSKRVESSYTTSHTWWYMNGLQQGASYTFHVSALAQDGTSRGESTNFRAMQRKIVITIERAVIHNDSDPVGNGELQMFADAAGQYIGGTAEQSKGDGSTITFGKSITLYKAKSQVKVDVAVRDNDCTYLCYAAPYTELKVIDTTDWEQGYGYKVLSGLQLPGYATDVPFSITSSGPVKFTAYGRYTLTVG